MRSSHSRLLALIVAVVLVGSACGDDSSSSDSAGGSTEEAAPAQPAPEGIDGVEAIRAPGDRQHLDGDLDYPTTPPIGGDHNEVWANCGFYDSAVPDENVVHTLEHGAVWVAYGSDAPSAELDGLRQRVDAESFLIATAYDGLSSPYVLTAWERRLELDSISDPRFDEFLTTYIEGPTTPEPGAPCTGAAG
jgi:hypothetical protein